VRIPLDVAPFQRASGESQVTPQEDIQRVEALQRGLNGGRRMRLTTLRVLIASFASSAGLRYINAKISKTI
jgi:hypothetical protein